MNDQLLSKHVLYGVLGAVIFFGLLINFWQLINRHSQVVYCARQVSGPTYIRVESVDIVIDPTPGPDTIQCIGRHAPTYDRSIELVIVTDVKTGTTHAIEELLTEYSIQRIIIPAGSASRESELLKKSTVLHHLLPREVDDYISVSIDGALLSIAPTQTSSTKAPSHTSVNTPPTLGLKLTYNRRKYVWVNTITDSSLLQKFMQNDDNPSTVRMTVHRPGDPITLRSILSGRDFQLILDPAIFRSLTDREKYLVRQHNIDIRNVANEDITKIAD